jgi:hypothetical protein
MNSKQAPETYLDQQSMEMEHGKLSMIYNVLPTAVRNRIPAMPSLRRAISDARGRSIADKSYFDTKAATAPITPPPGYTIRPSSAVLSTGNSLVTYSHGDSTIHEGFAGPLEPAYSTLPVNTISETGTGINWKYASQGMSMRLRAYDAADTVKG